jgi:transcriptional regulator with XRE-family HTH domain
MALTDRRTQSKLTMMTLGELIRKLRDDRDLSLREFASKLGCSAPFISDVELGRRFPSDKMLNDMARILLVDVEQLKAHDTRPPVEEMKQRIADDPRYALAFRTVIRNRNVTPDELLELANRKRPKKRTHENDS